MRAGASRTALVAGLIAAGLALSMPPARGEGGAPEIATSGVEIELPTGSLPPHAAVAPLPQELATEAADAAQTSPTMQPAPASPLVELPPLPDVMPLELAAPIQARSVDLTQFDLPPLPDIEAAFPGLVATQAPAPDLAVPTLAIPTLAMPDLPDPGAVQLSLAQAGRQAAITAALADPARQADALGVERLPRREREAIAAFYAARDHAPLWVDGKGWTQAAMDIVARLDRADEDGLRAADYRAPRLGAAEPPAALAEADLRLSALAVLYARDARGGRIDPSRLSNMMTPVLALPEAAEVMTKLADAPDTSLALASYQPRHAGYLALRAALAQARASRPQVPSAAAPLRVPPGNVLRIGMRDARVPLIRARFGLGPEGDGQVYDAKVAAAIADFQRENALPVTGVLTRQTMAALSGASLATGPQEADIVANMERWRWLPAELGERHVFVDIPAYRVSVMDGTRAVHEARVVVGKPETPTPIFSDVMEHVVVNPSWYIPPSILKKDVLPKLAQDPTYAERMGYEVTRRGNSISVRQPPGERNALGHIKFMFPNNHAVYLHDTPSRHLFGRERRAFSHGCVRVDDPMQLAEIVLGVENGWSEERVRAMVGRGERTIHLRRPLPVHLTYFTLHADASGNLVSREDIYGFHRRVREALAAL
jgi:murein L,D-transpeptidase YcbB/YkuD